MGHQRFLPLNHRYQRLKAAFDGNSESRVAPIPLTGEQVYEKVKDINVTLGKFPKEATVPSSWKKKSIFWDLPYWRDLDVRHCIDVMHLERNVCDSLIGTLLNIKGKSKDGLKSRNDLVEMGIRKKLHPVVDVKRTYLPPASYTLSKREKTIFCKCLRGIKVPHGYSSNIRKLVQMKELKLVGLKSHDCHVLMQQFLPIAIRSILTDDIRPVITQLCMFFSSCCKKEFDVDELDDLEEEAVVLLCKLEMFFPPSFFDIMIHLIVHIVREIKICGPVYLRWMYPIERYMKVLKGYVKNLYRPEASIVERYIAEEAIEYCTYYFRELKHVGVPLPRHEGRQTGRPTDVVSKHRDEIEKAHLCVLNNSIEVLPYITAHQDQLKRNFPNRKAQWLALEHKRSFIEWFRNEITNSYEAVSPVLRALAHLLNHIVTMYNSYDINN